MIVRPHKRGFALLMAICLLGLVAAALALFATMTVWQVKKNRINAAEAQVRQLLVYGEVYARRHIDELARAKTTRAISLPPELISDSTELRITSTPANDAVTIHVDASQRARRTSQDLLFSHTDRWRLQSAKLAE